MIILTLCSYGCKSDKDEFKITDVQFVSIRRNAPFTL